MIYTLIIETENLSEVLPIIEFAEKLGASVKIEPKIEAVQESTNKPDENQKEK